MAAISYFFNAQSKHITTTRQVRSFGHSSCVRVDLGSVLAQPLQLITLVPTQALKGGERESCAKLGQKLQTKQP